MEPINQQSFTKPESEAQIAAMFDRIAPRYDFLNRLLSARQDQRWRKALVKQVPFRVNGRYLDVATGTGDVLFACRQIRSEYNYLLGVDISDNMLRLASEKAVSIGCGSEVEFKSMSAETLRVPDAEFDCVSISFGLRNVVNKDQALQEFRRVLKPNGRLIILEFFNPDSHILTTIFQFYFKNILPIIGGLFSDRAAYEYLPASVSSFYLAQELKAKLNELGFSAIEEKKFLFGSCRLISASLR